MSRHCTRVALEVIFTQSKARVVRFGGPNKPRVTQRCVKRTPALRDAALAASLIRLATRRLVTQPLGYTLGKIGKHAVSARAFEAQQGLKHGRLLL